MDGSKQYYAKHIHCIFISTITSVYSLVQVNFLC
jgi:hypothetical protein